MRSERAALRRFSRVREYAIRARLCMTRLMHDRSTASERALWEYLRDYRSVQTATRCLPRRVRFQDAAICPHVVQLPQFEVRRAWR
jgi:hypothetical protein